MSRRREDVENPDRSRLSMTDRLRERIRQYAPYLEISREEAEFEIMIGQSTSAEYGTIDETWSLYSERSSSNSVLENVSRSEGSLSVNSDVEVNSVSVPEENEVTFAESCDGQVASNTHLQVLVTDPVKLTRSYEVHEEVQKYGQSRPSGWWNLWGLFSRTPKVHPLLIPQNFTAAAPESVTKIGKAISLPQNIEANSEVERDVEEGDASLAGVTSLRDEGQTVEPKILEPGISNPFESSLPVKSLETLAALSCTSGTDQQKLAKNSSTKMKRNVESVKKEAEKKIYRKGQVVPVEILYPRNPQVSIEGEDSDEDPSLFGDDRGSFPIGGHIPPILSASIIGNISDGSVWIRGQTLLRKDYGIPGPETKESPKTKWKSFFRKKKKDTATVTKMEKQITPATGEKKVSWIGLKRSVREGWTKLTGRKRVSVDVAVAPPTIFPEQVAEIDEVSDAWSSALRTQSDSILTKLEKPQKSKKPETGLKIQ